MATVEDLRKLLEQNSLFMQLLQETQRAHMNQVFEAFTAAAPPDSHGARNLDERRFRVLNEGVEIGAVQIDRNMKEAGRGRITIPRPGVPPSRTPVPPRLGRNVCGG